MAKDLLHQEELREVVRRAYGAIPAGGGARVTLRLYDDDELRLVPEGAVTWALGVGNPTRHADLRTGETVLDVGSGGGIDSIIAAHRVGPAGHVIGVDLLPQMCERASRNAEEAGVSEWTEFRVGEMEALPVDDASIDVVISNGAINLSARKSRALAEIHRVLKPGGRLCAADLVVDNDLPPEVLTSDSAWAG